MIETTLEARAINTTKNYVPKQQEFIAWALRSNYPDRDTVTELKLISFLEEEVVKRPLRRQGKKALAAKEVELDKQVLKWSSVRGYVTAITDLYNTQKARNMNSNPSPRASQIRGYIKALQRRDTALAKQNYADKGRDTYLDGYTESQFKDMCVALWRSSAAVAKPECYLRTLVDQLLGHYLVARGQDRRHAEISDIHTFEFPDEGSTPCFPLIVTMRESKANQYGRLETMGALRNKDPWICPLGALGFYLLYRWDLTEEPFPDFTERSRWYNTRLLLSTRGRDDVTEPLSYNAQHEWTSKAHGMAGINSTKITHIDRGAAPKRAELLGVSEDQIARAGRWARNQMIGCYLTCLPLEFMRRMGGHPAQRGCFEIKRAVTPPDELLALIWPGLDSWKGRFGIQEGQIDDLAAEGFYTLLQHLRTVILQDSVPLMEAFPNHPIWAHPVFHHIAYKAFASKVKSCHQDDATPSLSTRILEAMPDLIDNLQAISSQVVDHSRAHVEGASQMTQIESKIETMAQAVKKTQETLQYMTGGGLMFQLMMTPPSRPASIVPLPLFTPPSPLSSSPDSLSLSHPPPPPPQQHQQQHQQEHQQHPIDLSPPLYRMRRDVQTVEHLYREWTEGLHGSMSILELNRRYGHHWRRGRRDELQFYSLRHEIIKEIDFIATCEGISQMSAMQRLQGRQDREKWSLDKLCKRLRQETKIRRA